MLNVKTQATVQDLCRNEVVYKLKVKGCGRIDSFAQGDSYLSDMTWKYLSGSNDKNCLNSRTKEKWLKLLLLTPLAQGTLDMFFMKGCPYEFSFTSFFDLMMFSTDIL